MGLMDSIKKKTLNLKQKQFCQAYLSNKYFGNGTLAYQEIYNVKNYNTAKTNASKLLTNTNIAEYIERLLVDMGLNDKMVDSQLAFLIKQNGNLNVKLQAIREYHRYNEKYKRAEVESRKKQHGEVDFGRMGLDDLRGLLSEKRMELTALNS